MPQLSIYMLGPLQVRLGDKSITRAFRTEKERALLVYLAVERGRVHSRDALAELLWPDRPQGVGRTNLRQALTGLRTTLGDRQHERPLLMADDEHVRLNPERDLWLDIDAFRAQIQETLAHPHPNIERCPTCAGHLAKAVDLYRDDFLGDFVLSDSQDYQEWLVFQREQYYSDLLVAMNHLVAFHSSTGDLDTAQAYARQYVSIAPLEENAHRQLMAVLFLSGRRAAAVEQYHACRQLLSSELGIEPGPETLALFERIKTGTGPTAPIPGKQSGMRDLPITLTTFVGRQQEMEWLERCLPNPTCRLITLVGMPGAGKTRLALQAVMQFGDLFEHGVHYVPLDSVHSTAQLSGAIGSALGIQRQAGEEALEGLLEFLRPLDTLILLDHFDHLPGGPELLLELLKNAPRLKLLLTTQQRLEYQSACIYQLGGLPYPQDEHDPHLHEYPALELFLARAQRSRSAFQLTQENLPLVTRILRLADGLPLAIELAAARVREYTVRQIADRMGRGLDILSTTLVDMPARHRSLRAVFDHAAASLSPSGQSLLPKLSLFEGPITPEAAEQITAAPASALFELADRSLLEGIAARGYTLHPLLKRYAAERLEEQGLDVEHLETRHSRYFLDYLFAREHDLGERRKAQNAADEIGHHLPDIRRALDRAAAQGDRSTHQRALDVLHRYYEASAMMYNRHCNFWKIEVALVGSTRDSQIMPILERALSRQDFCCGRKGCLEEAGEAFLLEGEDQQILDANYQACQLTGYTRSELLDMRTSGWEPAGLHAAPEDDQRFQAYIRRQDGSRLPVEVIHTRFNLDDEVYYLSVLQGSVQEAAPRGAKPEESLTDPLTGLLNRIEFLEIVRDSLSRAARGARRIALLLTDIDQLSSINNRYGYEAGDAVLKVAATRLVQALRTGDVIARVSGDEFAVLVEPLFKVEHTAAVARKVQQALREPYDLDGVKLSLSVSIGICIYPEGGADAGSLLANADRALQQAKTAEGGGFQVYPPQN